MKYLLKKALLKKLKQLDLCSYKELNLDKRSFESGYANGFVNGFYFMNKWVIGILILLIISLIFNFILFFQNVLWP